ncbi:MAG: hypothetical protein AMXMBFR66_13340 [Pseudomonadota bacterium]|nr:[NiFe]-hydrogenase assembly chaperone HybE [Rubrivivax sp.]
MNGTAAPSRVADGTAATAALRARVAALCALFEHVARTRMAGLPLLHAGLAVHAEGFEPEADGRCAWGVLLTPWFMNLVRLPLAADASMALPGRSCARTVGCERLDFIGAHDPGLGAYEICSLFSPMSAFVDQAAAVATAQAVLAELRRPPPGPATPPGPAPEPARRALLLGRSAGFAREA